MSDDQAIPPAAVRPLAAACAALFAVAAIGAATHRGGGGSGAAGPTTTAALPPCPSGPLRWDVTSVRERLDPLNTLDVTVVVAGTVHNLTGASVSIESAVDPVTEAQAGSAPGAGATLYPVYLTLDDADLYPGDASGFSGGSPEVGVQALDLVRGKVAYTTAWDAPEYADRCPPPPEIGG